MTSAMVLVVLLLGSVVLLSVILVAALVMMRGQWDRTTDARSSDRRTHG
jgi:hypothetical protein